MRHKRIVVVLVGALCALAVAAVPAFAAEEFVASRTGKVTGRGYNEIEVERGEVAPEFEPAQMQDWRLGAFKIDCYKAHESGAVEEGRSPVFTTTIKLTKCGWYPETNSLHVPAQFSKSGLTIEYLNTGLGEGLGNEEGEELEYKPRATIRETAASFKISAGHLCKIIIPEQTLAPVHYGHRVETGLPVNSKNLAGEQTRLLITNEFKKIKFKYGAEGEEPETQCHDAPEFEKTAEEGGGQATGTYTGTLEEWITGAGLSGNLSFE